eukprot:5589387-Prymnesium_polylepis.1
MRVCTICTIAANQHQSYKSYKRVSMPCRLLPRGPVKGGGWECCVGIRAAFSQSSHCHPEP